MKNNKIKSIQSKYKAIFYWFLMIISSLFAFSFVAATPIYVVNKIEVVTKAIKFSETIESGISNNRIFTLQNSYAADGQVPELQIRYLDGSKVIQKAPIAFSYQSGPGGSRKPNLNSFGKWIDKNTRLLNRRTWWTWNKFEDPSHSEWTKGGALQPWLSYENSTEFILNNSWIENGNSFPLSLILKTTSLEINFMEEVYSSYLKNLWNNEVRLHKHNKNFKLTIKDFKFDLQLKIAVSEKNDVVLKQYKTNLQFNIEYTYTNPKKIELNQFLQEKGQEIKKHIGSTMKVLTDSTASEGLKTKPEAGDISNQNYLAMKLKNLAKATKTTKYNSILNYEILKDTPSETKIQLFIHFLDPIDQKMKKYYVSDVPIIFELSEKAKKKNLKQRLKFIPSKVVKKLNGKYEIVDDTPEVLVAPKRERRENNVYIEDDGTVMYHAPISIVFSTSPSVENEILFINNRKIDVLDQKFGIKLNDIKTKHFTVEVFQYLRNNIHTFNQQQNIVRKYKKIITINSKPKKLNVKYFAWDPNNNIDQLIKISPFIKNWTTGKELLDENGDKVKNLEYDAALDPTTGTKKQILWVTSALPEGTLFPQDPLNSENKQTKNSPTGFIAEAVVSGKGTNLTLEIPKNDNNLNLKRFKINNLTNAINFVEPTNLKLSTSELDYFSSSGNWLYTLNDPGNLTSFKLVNIGKQNTDLFDNIFKNEKIISFWNSLPGKHLKFYLESKENLNSVDIENLSYEDILNYWKVYVSDTVKGLHLTTNKNFIFPSANEQLIRSTAKKTTKDSFINTLNKIDILNEFKNNNLINWTATLKENDLEIAFSIKQIEGSLNYLIEETKEKLLIKQLVFKDSNELNKSKIQITPSVDAAAILKLSQTQTKAEFEDSSLPEEFIWNFENSDKTIASIKNEDPNNLIIEYKIASEYKKKYYLSTSIFLVKTNFLKNSLEYYDNNNTFVKIFDRLTITKINLNGHFEFEAAKKFVINLLEQKLKLKYQQDWIINNFDKTIEKLVKKVFTLKEIPIEETIFLETNPEKNHFIGKKSLILFNQIESNDLPPIQNLIQVKLDNLTFAEINKEKLIDLIETELTKQYAKYKLNFKKLLKIVDFESQIYKLLKIKQINKVKLTIVPKNNYLVNQNFIEITNDLTNITNAEAALIEGANNSDNAEQAIGLSTTNKTIITILVSIILFVIVLVGIFFFIRYKHSKIQ